MFKSIELPPHKYPCTVYYGDGSTIEPEVIQHLRAVSWSCAVGFRWRKGDLLVLDNLTVQHGRIGFTGKREILVHLMTDWTSVLTSCFISSLDHEKFPSVLILNHFLFQCKSNSQHIDDDFDIFDTLLIKCRTEIKSLLADQNEGLTLYSWRGLPGFSLSRASGMTSTHLSRMKLHFHLKKREINYNSLW